MVNEEEIEIRIAEKDDLKGILQILGQPDMSDGDVPDWDDALDIFEALKAYKNHELYVIKHDGEIVATFALFFIQHFSHSGASSAIMEDVAVRTDWQRQGIGKIMNSFACKRAKEMNCYKIVLSSGKKRKQAHEFYEAQGYVQHGYSFLLALDDKH